MANSAMPDNRDGDEDDASTDKGRQFITALGRGLDVLRALAQANAPLGNQELARQTGFPRPTISRITYTLTRLGYLSYREDLGKYQLGLAALALGYSAMGNLYVRRLAQPLMQEVSLEVNLCCVLGYRDGTEAVYLEHTRGSRSLMLSMEVGSRVPLATTAMGRALLAAMRPDEREQVMRELAARDPQAWLKQKRGVLDSLRDYERHGYTVAAGEWEPEIHAVGVPLSVPVGHHPVALVLGGPAYGQSQEAFFADMGPRVLALAQRIAQRLALGA